MIGTLILCKVRRIMPELTDKELMPDKIKGALKKAGIKSTKHYKPSFIDIEIQDSYN